MPDPDDISDALLDEILADPHVRDILTEVMADAGIVEALVGRGFIRITGD